MSYIDNEEDRKFETERTNKSLMETLINMVGIQYIMDPFVVDHSNKNGILCTYIPEDLSKQAVQVREQQLDYHLYMNQRCYPPFINECSNYDWTKYLMEPLGYNMLDDCIYKIAQLGTTHYNNEVIKREAGKYSYLNELSYSNTNLLEAVQTLSTYLMYINCVYYSDLFILISNDYIYNLHDPKIKCAPSRSISYGGKIFNIDTYSYNTYSSVGYKFGLCIGIKPNKNRIGLKFVYDANNGYRPLYTSTYNTDQCMDRFSVNIAMDSFGIDAAKHYVYYNFSK